MIVLLLYCTHTYAGGVGGGLWSLCVCTEEQYVVIKQSWIGIINPCASLYNRPCPINSTETLEYRAHDPVDFFCLIHWNQFALSLRPTLLVLYILNKCFIRAEIKVFVDLFPNHTITTYVQCITKQKFNNKNNKNLYFMVISEVCSCINWQKNIRGSQDRSI